MYYTTITLLSLKPKTEKGPISEQNSTSFLLFSYGPPVMSSYATHGNKIWQLTKSQKGCSKMVRWWHGGGILDGGGWTVMETQPLVSEGVGRSWIAPGMAHSGTAARTEEARSAQLLRARATVAVRGGGGIICGGG